MNSLDDVWNGILAVLGQQLSSTALNTWFSDCRAVDLKENRLVLHVPTDFKRDIISGRFSGNILSALKDLFSADFTLTILSGDEIDSYNKKNNPDNVLPDIAGYTFDNFIVGPSNHLAYASSMAVAANPGKVYNPLFLYGNSGLGKTHLLMAVGNAIHEKHTSAKIVYLKGDDFLVDLYKAIQEGKQEEFRQKYRHADLLLMDDIHFIAGKPETQNEFFHTFNTLYESGKQIVVTSDRPPKEMEKLEDRLRTRLEWGLMADIQPPDLETRMAITRAKALQLGMAFPDDIVAYIAEKITVNIRQLEGVVKKLSAYVTLNGDKLTPSLVERATRDVVREGPYVPTPEIILNEVSRHFGIPEEAILGPSHQKPYVTARHIAVYLCRTLTALSLVEIGRFFKRDHTTILSSIDKIESRMPTDRDIAEAVRDITSNINSKNGAS